jgi:hypothetical protein
MTTTKEKVRYPHALTNRWDDPIQVKPGDLYHQCRSCVFYHPFIQMQGQTDLNDYGLCRRHPPARGDLGFQFRTEPEECETDRERFEQVCMDMAMHDATRWPYVHASECCGEHRTNAALVADLDRWAAGMAGD